MKNHVAWADIGCVTTAKQIIWEWNRQGSLDLVWGLDMKYKIDLGLGRIQVN